MTCLESHCEEVVELDNSNPDHLAPSQCPQLSTLALVCHLAGVVTPEWGEQVYKTSLRTLRHWLRYQEEYFFANPYFRE